MGELQQALEGLEPKFKDLRQATSALKRTIKLAAEETPDALPMHQALQKLEQSANNVADEALRVATDSFRSATERALEGLAFGTCATASPSAA